MREVNPAGRLHALRRVLLALLVVGSGVLVSVPEAQGTDLCFELVRSVRFEPTWRDVVKCKRGWRVCFFMPHCCLPSCKAHAECRISKRVWDEGGLKGEICDPDPKTLAELWARNLVRLGDDAIPWARDAVWSHVQTLYEKAHPLRPEVHALLFGAYISELSEGFPSFAPVHLRRARVLSSGSLGAGVFVRDDANAVTLGNLIILRPPLYRAIAEAPLPPLAEVACPERRGLANALAVLAHELVHVRQFDELGEDAFVDNYLLAYTAKGYRGNDFEKEGLLMKNGFERRLGLNMTYCEPVLWATVSVL